MTIQYDTVKTAHIENRLPTRTENWILPPDRLARNKSIIAINAIMLQHNPNHLFQTEICDSYAKQKLNWNIISKRKLGLIYKPYRHKARRKAAS